MKARVVFLVLLLITTSIPTVFFIFGLALFLSYYVQGYNSLWVDWHDQIIWLESAHGEGTGMFVWLLVLGLICTPLFCASILLLYREWQNRKKEKAKKAMTYTI